MTQNSAPQLLPEDGALPGSKDTRSRRGFVWRLLGTILSLALLVYLISAQGWDKFASALSRLPIQYFLFALALTLFSRICVALRWYNLVHSAGVKMSLWQSLRLTFMGLFASNFLPTTIGGDLVRMAGSLYLRLDAGVCAASLVVDRLVGMAGMASLAPFGLAIVLRPVEGASLGGAPLAPRWSGGLLPALLKLPGVGWLYRKTEIFVRGLLRSSIYWLRHPAGLAWAFLCTYGHMFFTFWTIWLLLRGMQQTLSFWWIGALWSLNYFVTTFVPISINGLGLQELTIATLYTQFGGVSAEAGLALAVIYRMLQLMASLPGVFFLPDILRPFPTAAQQNPPVEPVRQTP
jgi:glycosyltransferase 2 family protein